MMIIIIIMWHDSSVEVAWVLRTLMMMPDELIMRVVTWAVSSSRGHDLDSVCLF